MYEEIVALITKLGDELPQLAGRVADIGVKKKWLTEKDIEIESRLTQLISTFPGEHRVFAEEINDSFIDAENVWVIDPISSTSSFIRGLPHYAVVISHLHKGELKFAAVYDPTMKEMFSAERGKGAYLNGEHKLMVNNSTDHCVIFPPYKISGFSSEWISGITRNLVDADISIRNLGSFGLHYAYVAAGRVSGVIHYNKDTFPEFAGKLLIEEAGGKLTDFSGRELEVDTIGIIASNSVVHDELIKLVQSAKQIKF